MATKTARSPNSALGQATPVPVRPMTRAEVVRFIEALAAANPNAESELTFIDPFSLLVAVVLSAQATDASVNKATVGLFAEAPDPASMVRLGEEGVARHIRTIGLWRAKAKNVVALSRILVENHGGIVPSDRASLEALPGVRPQNRQRRAERGVRRKHDGGRHPHPAARQPHRARPRQDAPRRRGPAGEAHPGGNAAAGAPLADPARPLRLQGPARPNAGIAPDATGATTRRSARHPATDLDPLRSFGLRQRQRRPAAARHRRRRHPWPPAADRPVAGDTDAARPQPHGLRTVAPNSESVRCAARPDIPRAADAPTLPATPRRNRPAPAPALPCLPIRVRRHAAAAPSAARASAGRPPGCRSRRWPGGYPPGPWKVAAPVIR